jgi:hypothetical protein
VNLINTFLATGREVLTLERRLCAMAPNDPDWKRLGDERQELVRRKQDEIVAAVRAGVEWSTVEFALLLHGQHADREIGSSDPTPAEQLLELIRQYGGVAVVESLDAARAAGVLSPEAMPAASPGGR